MQEWIVTEQQSGSRIDKMLAEQLEEFNALSQSKRFLAGDIVVNGKTVKPSYKVMEGDVIHVSVPEAQEPEIVPEPIPLDILYEDSDVILVNKPKGMVVHPAAGHYSGTLVNALLYHCTDLSGINGILRPGIVHRIDMDTTGVLIACKNDFAHNSIAAQLKEHSITRRYEAIVYGNLREEEGTIEAPIGRHQPIAKKWQLTEKMEKKRSLIIGYWSDLVNIRGLSAAWKQAEHTKFVCIWQVLVIHCLEILYMVLRNHHLPCKGNVYMPMY